VFAEPLQNICQVYSVTVRKRLGRTVYGGQIATLIPSLFRPCGASIKKT
jgi:glycogen synthase